MSSLPEQTTLQNGTSDPTAMGPMPQATSRGRLFFLDHLRATLTILVVLFHLAAIYGANGAFYYVEPPGPQDQVARLVLLVFILVNQAYFMGCFFLISGYFTPGSFDRKGPGVFYKDRLLRLGIPLIVFVFVLSPIASLGFYQTPAGFPHLTPPFTWQQLPSLLGAGPLWFAEMLLCFCLGYVLWRLLRRTQAPPTQHIAPPPSYRAVGLFILVLALVSYVLRIVVPFGLVIPVLGFPTLCYLPQYLSFFILGALAFRRNWFQTIPASIGKVGLGAAVVSTLVLLPLAFSGGTAFLGYGTWQSAAYALWDSTFAVGICLALITFFRHVWNRQTRVSRFLSQQAFTVYIIHMPIIVGLSLAIRGIHLESLLKFALAALFGVPLCFALAFLVRRIPFASRIL
jgi:glucan biosynthesis protein C